MNHYPLFSSVLSNIFDTDEIILETDDLTS